MNKKQIELWKRLIEYGEKYEISIQLWPKYKTIFIAKDGVDLHSYGAHDLDMVLNVTLAYLDRINKKDETRRKNPTG